jgi:hypothetical protein
MDRIKVDEATVAALQAAKPGAELIGQDGNSVGVYVPAHLADDFHSYMAKRFSSALSEVSVEELRAADARGGEIPHEEVLSRLGLQ